MSLKTVCSVKAFQDNLKTEMRKGTDREQALAIAYNQLRKDCLTPELRPKAEKERWTPNKIVAMKRKKNPYPLMIATLANPDGQTVIERYLQRYPYLKDDVNKAMKLFQRIHGDNAVLKPVVIKDKDSQPHVEVVHGVIKNTTYDTGIVKGSKLADAVYYHPAGDKKYSRVNRPGVGTLSPDGRTHRVRYNRNIINPEGMMDG